MINDWLKLLCQLLPGVTRAVVVRQAKQTAMARWPEGDWAVDDLLAYAGTAGDQASCRFIPRGSLTHVVCPLTSNNLVLGTLCLELPLQSAQHATTERLLVWSKAWLELLLKNSRERASGFESLLALLSQATAADNLQANSYTLATALAQQFSLSQVIICTYQNEAFVTQAVANVFSFERRAEQFFLMEKSLQWRATELTVDGDFSHWLQAQDPPLQAGCLPMIHSGQCYGALVYTWPASRTLESQVVAQLKTISRLVAPSFAAQVQLREPWRWRMRRRWRAFQNSSDSKQKIWSGVGLCLLAIAAALLPVAHRVKGEASLEGSVQRAIVSPEDGYLMQADVKAGEILKAGQVLARLDQKSILLEIKRWQSEKQEYEGQFNRQLNALDHTQMRIAKAKVAQAEAKLDLYKDRLHRLTVTAPIDGVVIKGDLSRAIGSPVERGQVLYEMAPLDQFKLVVMVPEKDVRYLQQGQGGRAVLSSYPSDPLPFTVTSVASVFDDQQNEVLYRVEAEVNQGLHKLRPGMSGIAKVEVGRKSLAWVVLHPMWRWLQLKLWSL